MGRKAKADRVLPKHVGGVKLPKDVRKGVGKLVKVVASPAGRELIAGGLALAAAAIKAQAGKQREAARLGATPSAPATPATPTPPQAAPRATPNAANAPDPHEIGAELGRMAEAALAGLFGTRKKG